MNWKDDSVETVWQHGRAMPDADPSVWRQDACGAWMRRDKFGDSASPFGWKIEKLAGGVPDRSENLRPFHWRNHFDIAGNNPHCEVKADRAGVPAGEYVRPPRNRGN